MDVVPLFSVTCFMVLACEALRISKQFFSCVESIHLQDGSVRSVGLASREAFVRRHVKYMDLPKPSIPLCFQNLGWQQSWLSAAQLSKAICVLPYGFPTALPRG